MVARAAVLALRVPLELAGDAVRAAIPLVALLPVSLVEAAVEALGMG